MEYDLLNLPFQEEFRRHKLRRTIPAPNSYFFHIECNKCQKIKTCFSHGHSQVKCIDCNQTLAVPSGGKLKIKGAVASAKIIRKDD